MKERLFKYHEQKGFLPREVTKNLTTLFNRATAKNSEIDGGKCDEVNNDPAFDLLLDILTPAMSELLNEELVPTYSFARRYYKNAGLRRHTDRNSCYLTVSITLENSNDEPWPLFVEVDNMEIGTASNVGDLVVLKGQEITHWREPLTSKSHLQLFLHYVPNSSKYKKYFYDERASLSLDVHKAGLLGLDEKYGKEHFPTMLRSYAEIVRIVSNRSESDVNGNKCI